MTSFRFRSCSADMHPQPFWHELGLLFVVNQVIALLLTTMGGPGSLFDNVVIANAIGASIWALYELAGAFGLPKVLSHVVATPLGLWSGFKLATLFGVHDVTAQLTDPLGNWRLFASCLLLAGTATLVIVLYFRAARDRAALAAEQRRAAELHQAETAAQLALLQAQIEPHFLFNTLANVRSLIAADPPLAQTMLDHLNGYLRASLGRTRRPRARLADELQIVEPLLAIAAIRLQARLRYRIDVAETLRDALLPPLLLQPLVENALEHGIEAAVDGGEIVVSARNNDGLLTLTVRDTGLGLNAEGNGDGIGLANVRQRLASLYGEQGRLALYPNPPRGVIAELTLPLQREPQP
ncbi:sensor histidine kinase [Jeongeupia naejangsanensis]|uniref:histidine kinase n=1 Tax=Jeongeupia naejangsanensis TaxID=613195 RepID=A0ABS2BQ73_9NEIS|nr:histidine kinase [Jeongeupia naejangsanensis]MBM3117776.1 histidine kinase [Jeongeupia naejangsanensis]